MRLKSLGAGDAFTGSRGLLVVFLAEIDDTRAAHKGIGADSRPHARGATRWQGVAWAGYIVADGLGRVRADKDGAGVADVRQPVAGSVTSSSRCSAAMRLAMSMAWA